MRNPGRSGWLYILLDSRSEAGMTIFLTHKQKMAHKNPAQSEVQ